MRYYDVNALTDTRAVTEREYLLVVAALRRYAAQDGDTYRQLPGDDDTDTVPDWHAKATPAQRARWNRAGHTALDAIEHLAFLLKRDDNQALAAIAALVQPWCAETAAAIRKGA